MIKFRQKTFSEYDAMRSLYVELMKDKFAKQKYGVIDSSVLIPVLKGNNIVIERFVISTSFAHKDTYRMYLKIGAKAKLPDEVRLPGKTQYKPIGGINFNLSGSTTQKQFSDESSTPLFRQKVFGGGGGDKKKTFPLVSGNYQGPNVNFGVEVTKLLGEAIKYDKRERSLVLEFDSIEDAIKALNILPFGINYKIYLLNA